MAVSEYLCQRCGEAGEDRRTLFHSCLYAMDEMKEIPFEQGKVVGTWHPKVGDKALDLFKGAAKMMVPEFATEPASDFDRSFFTLRVCKRCRADWMEAIRNWFVSAPEREQSPGTGIFIRENGTTREITEEEWQRRNPNREPVRFKPPKES